MLEYNADTPTSLLESSIAQYQWQQENFPNGDQFNIIHSALVQHWKTMPQFLPSREPVHFAYMEGQTEDFGNTEYLRSTAEQAGLSTVILPIEKIGWDQQQSEFVDDQDQVIQHLFKLYPWEWLIDDPYGPRLTQSKIKVKEPIWKMILSNKAILPLLWELFPSHPNLLPAYTTAEPLKGSYVKKPVFSREGANIELCQAGQAAPLSTQGPYNSQQAIYQALCPLPCFDGNYTVLGSWIVGGKAVGIGIREDESLITKNTSRFAPHCVI
jgi:glutathionylspermidine synthase